MSENHLKISEKPSFPVVGIGASAGGVEAVTELFKHIPSDIGMAFIYIQHLAPKQESMLTDILSRSTEMRVVTASDGTVILPNHVYVTPPAAIITLEAGKLKLSTKSEKFHYPIDSFLMSLAQEYKGRAIGIVLSGTGSDGTEGLRAIYVEGGVTIVQLAESARYRDMPNSALEQGVVHFALAPDAIANKLVAISAHPYIAREEPVAELQEDKNYKTILSLLKLKFGVDFSKYKENTINRRISRRMLIRKVEKLSDYITLLRAEPEELQALHNDMLIGVTNFFREPDAFKPVCSKLLPEIIGNKASEESIRVWVPGCATGEEAYSVAICVREALETSSKALTIQVFGTDINQKYIDKAREGVYPENITQHVSEDLLVKYFHKINGDFQVNKLIRDVCIFSKHDLTRDPPFSNLDLIFCRNVLIYLKPDTQERILNLFHYGLKKTGYLILGRSESTGKAESLFTRKEDSIFAKREIPTKIPITFESFEPFPKQTTTEKKRPWPSTTVQKTITDLLMERYGLASVLINETADILAFQSDLSPYMQTTPGEANFNLLNIIKAEIKVPVQTALIRARKERRAIKQEEIPTRFNGKKQLVSIQVIPLKTDETEGYYLVLFERPEIHTRVEAKAPIPETSGKQNDQTTRDMAVESLQKELSSTKETLSSVVEDNEATNEELRAALEEVQSGNEELQSTNEELETAKEELQSINEELNTVNRELVDRNETLNRLNDDLNNLFNNINMAIVVLDLNLRIRLFTPLAGERLNLLPTDVGRPIRDIRPALDIANVDKLASETINNLSPYDARAKDENDHSYLLRIRPYITVDKKINGAVISLIDVDVDPRKTRAK